ncbi:GGDEF domain-containing response regulator [Aliivibrio fischeri]|uniref:GGDEF domain-containing response regulator n=1 Tax=Aliivibrio fischeri TaxID=668 RepID=UPI00080E10EF|nr:diguanylate cyclase [Aliivibrio fischeri]MCE4936407.1 diguanylate cyclase [Aliivibrio fischeri]MUH95730.1 diguanylate cyclase [Aliivibrio fischeri]MUI62991.1 diguanylate cyclase [Aliivibrio fischeri]MUJ19078.1 diguanylate cyclase [Aliivibrio fischeri]OCH43142.1 diguanylate cyclase response regulator [Aliivibrio fischeri]
MLTEPKILIAEDEPVSRLVLQRLLKAFTCISVTNGQEALDVIHQEHIDLVLLDIHMPIMDGFEVIEKLKNDEATKNIPIIVITVNQSIEDEIRALDLGAVDFVTKPFHAVILQKRIRNQLALKLKSDLLEKHASLDGLTNLLNRRMFDFDLENRWAESQRLKGNLGLIIFDIDHFKLFNDNYGHSAGDEVLIRVAKALMRTLQRKTDRVYRYGGEEFTLIQFDTDLEQLRQTAELLRQCIYDLNITHEFSSYGRVSISVGAALINAESIKSEQFLLETADQQLYKAKKQGRNCISLISN